MLEMEGIQSMISTISKSIMDKLQRISNEIWDQNIDDCVELKEGMTNDSFFVTVNQRYYIIRLNGAGTNELINRKMKRSIILLFRDTI